MRSESFAYRGLPGGKLIATGLTLKLLIMRPMASAPFKFRAASAGAVQNVGISKPNPMVSEAVFQVLSTVSWSGPS